MPHLVPQPFALVELVGVLCVVELQSSKGLVEHSVNTTPVVSHIVATLDELDKLFHNHSPFGCWVDLPYTHIIALGVGFVKGFGIFILHKGF